MMFMVFSLVHQPRSQGVATWLRGCRSRFTHGSHFTHSRIIFHFHVFTHHNNLFLASMDTYINGTEDIDETDVKYFIDDVNAEPEELSTSNGYVWMFDGSFSENLFVGDDRDVTTVNIKVIHDTEVTLMVMASMAIIAIISYIFKDCFSEK